MRNLSTKKNFTDPVINDLQSDLKNDISNGLIESNLLENYKVAFTEALKPIIGKQSYEGLNKVLHSPNVINHLNDSSQSTVSTLIAAQDNTDKRNIKKKLSKVNELCQSFDEVDKSIRTSAVTKQYVNRFIREINKPLDLILLPDDNGNNRVFIAK